MTAFEDRKAAKIDRYRSYAANARGRATTAHRTAEQIRAVIPFGQPILVGHHSEGRHRRDLDRQWNAIGRSVEENRKADHWQRRADAVESDTSISKADPEAVTKLRAKVDELTAQRDRLKAYNKTCRKGAPDLSILSEREKAGLLSCIRANQVGDNQAMPAYALSNLTANIRRYEKRLTAQEAGPSFRTITCKYGGECDICEEAIHVGDQALHVARGLIRHLTCTPKEGV